MPIKHSVHLPYYAAQKKIPAFIISQHAERAALRAALETR